MIVRPKPVCRIVYSRSLSIERLVCRHKYDGMQYAIYVIEGRWKPCEATFAENPYVSICYAQDVLNARFRLGEPVIKKSQKWWETYKTIMENIGITVT